MADERFSPTTTGSRDEDRILDYVHDRYRRRKRIQRASRSVAIVLIAAVGAVALLNHFRSPTPLRSIGPGAGATSFLSLSCQGVARGARPPASGAVARKIVDAVVNLSATLGTAGTRHERASSGVVVSSTGEVLTTSSAVAGATSIKAVVAGRGGVHTAHVIGDDNVDDIAMLQIDGVSKLETMPFGDPAKIRAGESVIAIGRERGGGALVSTRGKVVAVKSATMHGMIESTVRVPAAGAGGPLVDAQGYAIGIDDVQPFGGPGRTTSFAIPIDRTAAAVARICGRNRVERNRG